jgi:hypothetical protein
MTRKSTNKTSSWQKSATVELSDGWSLVTSSKARSAQMSRSTEPQSQAPQQSGQRAGELKEEVDKYLELWKSSHSYRNFAHLIQNWKAGVQPDGVVCLGLGSLSTVLNIHKRRSLWQLAVFLSISELVSSADRPEEGARVRLYAQEPRFTPTDHEIFSCYYVEVLDGNNARDYITPNTIVFAPFLQWTVMLLDILNDRDPAMCISIDIREALDQIEPKIRGGCTRLTLEGRQVDLERCSSVGKTFLAARGDVGFPEFELDVHALGGLRIYERLVDGDG